METWALRMCLLRALLAYVSHSVMDVLTNHMLAEVLFWAPWYFSSSQRFVGVSQQSGVSRPLISRACKPRESLIHTVAVEVWGKSARPSFA